ncbi:DUF5683 domain-containing protein [Hymenobacter sp. BT730]|uniref:DUF5683 domain-containing protein n=1 Tax=Hymenobacter sp. BT730 TaxID=3063332 RepID=UPI0026E06AD6|nr:DUF5683 domain-containing protein [Hymenobacter sp. BT730]
MHNGLRHILLAVLPVFLLAGAGKAQTVVTAGPDSAQVSTPPTPPDTTRRTERLFGWHVTRPKKAAILSAVLPGAGQIYNRKYWKLPLVYGAIGGTLAVEIFYQRLYKEYAEGYRARIDGDSTTFDKGRHSRLEPTDESQKANLVTYRARRDTWIAYTAVAYTLNIVDALVDAHLHDFDISDDLSLHWEPSVLRVPTSGITPGVAFSLQLKSKR